MSTAIGNSQRRKLRSIDEETQLNLSLQKSKSRLNGTMIYHAIAKPCFSSGSIEGMNLSTLMIFSEFLREMVAKLRKLSAKLKRFLVWRKLEINSQSAEKQEVQMLFSNPRTSDYILIFSE